MTDLPVASTSFFNGLTMEWTYTFVWPEIPTKFRVNNLRNMHHSVFAQKNAYWRERFVDLAQGCDQLAWCDITVDEVLPTRRSCDVGSSMPAVKAAIDGCVIAGVLPDDSPEFVRSLTFTPPVYVKGEERLIVTLKGPANA